jgi:hypothetical protein
MAGRESMAHRDTLSRVWLVLSATIEDGEANGVKTKKAKEDPL